MRSEEEIRIRELEIEIAQLKESLSRCAHCGFSMEPDQLLMFSRKGLLVHADCQDQKPKPLKTLKDRYGGMYASGCNILTDAIEEIIKAVNEMRAK